jgi:hypothetical protein
MTTQTLRNSSYSGRHGHGPSLSRMARLLDSHGACWLRKASGAAAHPAQGSPSTQGKTQARAPVCGKLTHTVPGNASQPSTSQLGLPKPPEKQTVPVPSARNVHEQVWVPPSGVVQVPQVVPGVHPPGPPWHSPLTHSCPSAQRLPQRPQWRSFLCRLTHLPLQQVCVERQRLPQLPQWRSFLRRFTHLSPQRVSPSEHRSPPAQATPGKEAKAAPTRAPPTNLSAWRLETLPLASPLASSSKECSPMRGHPPFLPCKGKHIHASRLRQPLMQA